MDLKYKDKVFLLKSLPKVELCYEKKIYNTVQEADVYLIIPKGLKYFLWFKTFKNKNCCFLLQLSKNKKTIANIEIYNCCFNPILCSGNGTLFYGTIIQKEVSFFNIEDIFYFKGHDIRYYNIIKKINETNYILNNFIKHRVYSENDIVLGMPITTTEYSKIQKYLKSLPYNIYSIQHRFLNNRCRYNEIINNTFDEIKTFLIKPTVNTDIYQLYFLNNNEQEKHTMAFVNTYKLSVYMNTLFRNIRENNNLDLIEESEDEEDFENTNIDKNVYLEKKFKFKCVYNRKYKLWIPLEISKEKIASKKDIFSIEKK